MDTSVSLGSDLWESKTRHYTKRVEFSPGREERWELDRAVKPMSAPERAVWEDAEGYYDADGYIIRISQKCVEPLIDYCEGARWDGVPSRIIRREPKKTEKTPHPSPYYEATISGADNVAKEIMLTEPWRRHPDRINQIKKMKESLQQSHSPRDSIVHAKEILGLNQARAHDL